MASSILWRHFKTAASFARKKPGDHRYVYAILGLEVKQMEMLEHWNAAIAYIERNLCTECDPGKAAGIACVTEDSFLRFFSYMTGMTLSQYIRRRRLTLAAQELRESTLREIDIAVKYG